MEMIQYKFISEDLLKHITYSLFECQLQLKTLNYSNFDSNLIIICLSNMIQDKTAL